jgi:predicted nuclease of predicted toxin-antitoxin system
MKLLFDQNLSPRLPRLLADIYPDSVHVREIGLRDANDSTIWEYAAVHGYTIVSKDSDFQQRSLLFGSPPKFVWLRVGNCTVQLVSNCLAIAASWIGGAQARAGFFFDHDAFGVAESALLRELVSARSQGALRVAR